MLKLKYLDYNEELAIAGVHNWTDRREGITELFKYFRISSNAMYPFCDGEKVYYLRMAPIEEKIESNLQGEIEFINYLLANGYDALVPVKSLNGNYIEKISMDCGKYYASVFEQVSGMPIEDIEVHDAMLCEYGRALGKLHALSVNYTPVIRKWSYEEVFDWIHNELGNHKNQAVALRECESVRQKLDALEKTPQNYGLVHYDFEVDNVFYDEETKVCNVIDFEDGMYHWYGLDIEQVFDSLLDIVEVNKLEEAKMQFLEGYKQEFDIADIQIDNLPLFRRFIDLYSYTRILYSSKEVMDDEADWMLNLREKLENKKQSIMAKWDSVLNII